MFGSNLQLKINFRIKFIVFFAGFFIPFILNAQPREVVAKKGEGVYRLLTRNGLSASEYMDAFIELNKGRLGEDNMLFAGAKYILPDTEIDPAAAAETTTSPVKTARFDIFGEDYAEVEILDDKLDGAIYYLVAGHGGPDPGAVGYYNNRMLCEDEYAYDVTLRLARELIEYGATVYMITRDQNDGIRDESYLKPDKDERCYPNQVIPINQLRRLRQRTDAVNNLYRKNRGAFQRMIAIHVDARSHGENIDVFFYHDRRSTNGEKASRTLQNKFQEKYDTHQPGRGYHGTVSPRALYVVRNTYPVAVYIELGNINHFRDQQRFILPNNRQALANWLTEGLLDDFDNNK
ncbi:N-acetylmuramoyl-L-alanine amidase [Tangfeifania diversioriginum]|uniref:N-acetylmuramoyl-L-alanine amidase n=1 Tax=Tangfeifania diversioriginum TaxID=1168035 RepID=A0A1M6FNP9_9BACT|nr:N-acetylmuramoyl-L-alanine amidase [Tangfeifania diversioriginum]SHI99229.1 N-acetylmuramoyl-L-alanine amidase [Tangfeifania diversioriginum]